MVAQRATSEHKRHGKHQKHTRHFLKVYWPYMPLAVILGVSLVFSVSWQPKVHRGVLAYATSMSRSSLLQATNHDRSDYHVAALNLNAQLDQAAQTKANDMATRNYWSHNTPEGNPPWVFITNAGYQYKSAGENLAYGFITSEDTVAGWMNSPEHKANMLNKNFVDVGFGFANSSNYQNSGPETIVVAMYAQPLVATPAAVVNSSAPTASPQTKAATSQVKAPTATVKKQPAKKTSAPVQTLSPSTAPVVEPAQISVSRAGIIARGSLPWLATFAYITFVFSVVALVTRHSIALHKWLRRGERYVLHHAIFDVTIISLMGLSIIVSQTAGYIR